jgi:hypothetical protein
MKHTTLLTLAGLAACAVTAAAQTPERVDSAKTQTPPRIESQTRNEAEAPRAQGAGPRFVDADGDGVCDNCTGQGKARGNGAAGERQGRGPGDGTGNQGMGPRDGSGRGRGAAAGRCDGSGGGQRGRGRRQGRR